MFMVITFKKEDEHLDRKFKYKEDAEKYSLELKGKLISNKMLEGNDDDL